MKKYTTISLIGLIVMFAASCERIDEVEDAKQKLKEKINSFYEVQEQQKVEAIASHYSNDSETISLGPNSGDRYVGTVQIQKFWQQLIDNASEIKIWRRDEILQINLDGDTAWISSVNQVEMKRQSDWQTVRYFFSGVLKMDSGNWYFVQTHFSIPQDTFLKSNKPVENIEQHSQIDVPKIQPPEKENKIVIPPPSPVEIDTPQKTNIGDTIKTFIDSVKTKIDSTTENK